MQVDQQVETERSTAKCGEILQRERLERGITLSAISQATKISVSHLKSLERNEFSALPGGAFTKGFLRAYAAHVGLNPEEMVNHYLFEIAGRSETPQRTDSLSPEEVHRRRQRQALLAGGAGFLALVLAAVAWFFLGS
jgi:cytoskeleton protein RodZ